MCFLFHKWGKWEQYEQKMNVYVRSSKSWVSSAEARQKRVCTECGKMEIDVVDEADRW